MDAGKLKSIIEAILFSQSEPVGLQMLCNILNESKQVISQIVDELVLEYDQRNRGFKLVPVQDGFQFRTLPEAAPWILELRKKKPARLSKATLEVLTIIAYNQPVTRTEIEQIRGVESSAIIRNLVEKNLITVVARKEIPGRPLLYGTTRRFLEVLGIPDLASLPPIPESVFDDGEIEPLEISVESDLSLCREDEPQ